MARFLCIVGLALFSSCLAKFTYNHTGPEYPGLAPLAPVEVFLTTEPPYPVETIGTLAFTDPLPRKIQIEEAKRIARSRGGNVIVRIKNDLAESQGGFAFRIARVENLDRLVRSRNARNVRFGSGITPVGSYGGFGFADGLEGEEGSVRGEPAPFTYYPD